VWFSLRSYSVVRTKLLKLKPNILDEAGDHSGSALSLASIIASAAQFTRGFAAAKRAVLRVIDASYDEPVSDSCYPCLSVVNFAGFRSSDALPFRATPRHESRLRNKT
jgi:hypothetical protein